MCEDIFIKEEVRGISSQHKFRHLSREVCGEVYDIPEDNRVIFAYERKYGKETLIGGLTYHVANKMMSEPTKDFDSPYYHLITFLFIKSDFQGMGVGTRLVHRALKLMKEKVNRPIRVQSAKKALGFFQKLGFIHQSESPIQTVCGIGLFHQMYNMEKPCFY